MYTYITYIYIYVYSFIYSFIYILYTIISTPTCIVYHHISPRLCPNLPTQIPWHRYDGTAGGASESRVGRRFTGPLQAQGGADGGGCGDVTGFTVRFLSIRVPAYQIL